MFLDTIELTGSWIFQKRRECEFVVISSRCNTCVNHYKIQIFIYIMKYCQLIFASVIKIRNKKFWKFEGIKGSRQECSIILYSKCIIQPNGKIHCVMNRSAVTYLKMAWRVQGWYKFWINVTVIGRTKMTEICILKIIGNFLSIFNVNWQKEDSSNKDIKQWNKSVEEDDRKDDFCAFKSWNKVI